MLTTISFASALVAGFYWLVATVYYVYEDDLSNNEIPQSVLRPWKISMTWLAISIVLFVITYVMGESI